jgi:hypothetical protein
VASPTWDRRRLLEAPYMGGSPARQRPFCNFLQAAVRFAEPRDTKASSPRGTIAPSRFNLNGPPKGRFQEHKALEHNRFLLGEPAKAIR